MRCKLEKQWFLDPEGVSARLDELYGLILYDPKQNTASVAYHIGYIKAHIERDAEEYSVAVKEVKDDE